MQPKQIDPRRHPAAVSAAITNEWRPYRWRAYVVGVLAGLLAGGVAAPIVTTSLLMALYLIGAGPPNDIPWQKGAWLVAFALATAAASATVFARWQPQNLRHAAETYLWLAMRAETNWARVTGSQRVPRDERSMRAFLATAPQTTDTAGERFGLWIALLEVDRARAAVDEMPAVTPADRYAQASAAWLTDFVEGKTHPLEPLQSLVDAIESPEVRQAAGVEIAVSRARVAIADGQDWRAPLAAVRTQLGTAPDAIYQQWVWWPVFRSVLVSTLIGVTVYWVAFVLLAPHFPFQPVTGAQWPRAQLVGALG